MQQSSDFHHFQQARFAIAILSDVPVAFGGSIIAPEAEAGAPALLPGDHRTDPGAGRLLGGGGNQWFQASHENAGGAKL